MRSSYQNGERQTSLISYVFPFRKQKNIGVDFIDKDLVNKKGEENILSSFVGEKNKSGYVPSLYVSQAEKEILD